MVDFWRAMDDLVAVRPTVIDRAKGTAHPRYPDMIYPLDYGYLDGTAAADGDGIDVWLGSGDVTHAAGIICTLDAVKRDAEIKLLLGCSPDEMQSVIDFFQMNGISSLLVKRENA
jgi:inorganic pyrophosphatase